LQLKQTEGNILLMCSLWLRVFCTIYDIPHSVVQMPLATTATCLVGLLFGFGLAVGECILICRVLRLLPLWRFCILTRLAVWPQYMKAL